MDQQTRLKLVKLYSRMSPAGRTAIKEEFPELANQALRIVAFRVPLDPGKLNNQDGVPLMEVTYEGESLRLSERFYWTLHTNPNGTQILSAKRRVDDEGDF